MISPVAIENMVTELLKTSFKDLLKEEVLEGNQIYLKKLLMDKLELAAYKADIEIHYKKL